MYHIFFIHSSVDGHLSCFHVLATVNTAAMNIGVHGSFRTTFFPEVYFTYGPGPPHGTVSRHGSPHCASCRACNWVLVPRPSLSAPLKGKDASYPPSLLSTALNYRLLREGCPSAGILGTLARKLNEFMKQERSILSPKVQAEPRAGETGVKEFKENEAAKTS